MGHFFLDFEEDSIFLGIFRQIFYKTYNILIYSNI